MNKKENNNASLKRLGRTHRKRKRRKLLKFGTDLFNISNCFLNKNLRKFLKQRGQKKDKTVASLNIHQDAAIGRGLQARHFIDINTTIMRIPYKALITCQTVVDDDVLYPLIIGSGRKFKVCDVLSLFLLYEKTKGLNSTWFAYLESLPTAYSVLSYLEENEIIMLPNFLQKIYADFQVKLLCCLHALNEIWQNLLKSGKVRKKLTFCDIKWAWFTVNTRCVYMEEADIHFLLDKNGSVLAPYLDLLNHSFDCRVDSNFNKETNCFEIITLNSYKKYEQVFINYGPHNNLKLLSDYGFIIPNNPHDCIEIPLEEIISFFRCRSFPCPRKVLLYKKRQIIEKNFNSRININYETHSWNLELIATILLMTSLELEHWKEVYKNVYALSSYSLGLELIRSLVLIKVKEFENHLETFNEMKSRSSALNTVKQMIEEYCKILHNYLSKN